MIVLVTILMTVQDNIALIMSQIVMKVLRMMEAVKSVFLLVHKDFLMMVQELNVSQALLNVLKTFSVMGLQQDYMQLAYQQLKTVFLNTLVMVLLLVLMLSVSQTLKIVLMVISAMVQLQALVQNVFQIQLNVQKITFPMVLNQEMELNVFQTLQTVIQDSLATV